MPPAIFGSVAQVAQANVIQTETLMVAQKGAPKRQTHKCRQFGHRPGKVSVAPRGPPNATGCSQIKAKLVAATERNQSETRRTQNPQSGQSAITIAVAVADAVAADVAIVSAMIAKSNSPKRCGTKRGNIFYA